MALNRQNLRCETSVCDQGISEPEGKGTLIVYLCQIVSIKLCGQVDKPMKKIFLIIFDLIFPRRLNDATIANISPADFYEKIPQWYEEIYPNMRAIFHYQNQTAKAMIKELKSSKNRHAAQIAAYALANFLEKNNLRDAIIIPMPISKKRRRKRGYNQCELIAKFFTLEILAREKVEKEENQETHFEIRTDILEKPVDTAKLALENRAGRLKANEGVFRTPCPLSHLEKHIIVIDDVVTTGSTMRSAIDTLRAAGAKNVSGVGITH
jgi:ComF family protein